MNNEEITRVEAIKKIGRYAVPMDCEDRKRFLTNWRCNEKNK